MRTGRRRRGAGAQRARPRSASGAGCGGAPGYCRAATTAPALDRVARRSWQSDVEPFVGRADPPSRARPRPCRPLSAAAGSLVRPSAAASVGPARPRPVAAPRPARASASAGPSASAAASATGRLLGCGRSGSSSGGRSSRGRQVLVRGQFDAHRRIVGGRPVGSDGVASRRHLGRVAPPSASTASSADVGVATSSVGPSETSASAGAVDGSSRSVESSGSRAGVSSSVTQSTCRCDKWREQAH